jgi:hypothetical protein
MKVSHTYCVECARWYDLVDVVGETEAAVFNDIGDVFDRVRVEAMSLRDEIERAARQPMVVESASADEWIADPDRVVN